MTEFEIKEVLLDFRDETRAAIGRLSDDVKSLSDDLANLKTDVAVGKEGSTNRLSIASWAATIVASGLVSAIVVWVTK